jgi:hypothetical protein|tara:strand:+ start:128 stop:394 length:267 start_codon:yes stop_codon:yes gene_type:complete
MAKGFNKGKAVSMGAQNQQQAKVNINPDDLADVVCEKCEGQTFVQVFLFKSLSAVMSPTGKKTMVPMQAFKCDECNHISKDFLPQPAQ